MLFRGDFEFLNMTISFGFANISVNTGEKQVSLDNTFPCIL
jgi:hypothetical protein